MSTLLPQPPPARGGRLVGRVVPVPGLRAEDRDAMWRVFTKYYADVTRAKFEADLAEKQEVVILRDAADRSLQGFSTIQVYRREVHGRPFVAVYSGDTVLEEAYWGQTTLQKIFVAYLLRTKLKNPLVPVYWFLISKGYKTYLLLTRNMPTYWPRHDRPTPSLPAQVLDLLARDKFGDAWRPEQGILHFDVCQGRLKRGVAPIEAGLLAHPDIRFFVERNPGHADGDELCCLGEVDLAFPLMFPLKLLRRSVARFLTRARRLWADASASS